MKSIHFLQKLQEREEQGLTRTVEAPQGIDFCSNDYLSFSTDAVLQKRIYENLQNVPSGSTPNEHPLPSVAWAMALMVPSPPAATTTPPRARAASTVWRAMS